MGSLGKKSFLLTRKPKGRGLQLSSEVSKSRALLAGGATAAVAQACLREWLLRVPSQGSARVAPAMLRWGRLLEETLRAAQGLGAPVGQLLRDVHPMIRREERLWERLAGLERQFGFQGAVALVLPWGVASLTGGVHFNWATGLGLGFQLAGLLLFYLMVRWATRPPGGEQGWIFELLTDLWLRVSAGQALFASLEAAHRSSVSGEYALAWARWLEASRSGVLQRTEFFWEPHMPESRALAQVLSALLATGAPAREYLGDALARLDDERQATLEERLSGLPSRLSLIFCAFFAPAVFLVLLGALWPLLEEVAF